VQVYVFLRLTTKREPDLQRAESEKSFMDPDTEKRHPFPSITSPPLVNMTLVVPAYNEQNRLPKMMEETMEYLEKRQEEQPTFSYEVIIVNDGSKDKTTEEALKFVEKYTTEKVRVLEFVQNRGKGGAVRMVCVPRMLSMVYLLYTSVLK